MEDSMCAMGQKPVQPTDCADEGADGADQPLDFLPQISLDLFNRLV
jgi:hypothetical protein